ncbi:MAG: PAC2 family protein [Chloroflexi bacterium]|nr:PAC2 family protein [Chloroflexota bacterium]
MQNPSLIVGWSEDAGKLGSKVVDYLTQKLPAKELAEMEPTSFFPLGEVVVEDDVAMFPTSKLYCCPEKNLVIFKSSLPRSQWHKFLNAVLDVVGNYGHLSEVYTIGSMVSLSAHTVPRQLLAVVNSTEIKRALRKYEIVGNMNYETPPGQRPTLSSFLLWVAKRRNTPAASLWVPIPFYLVSTEDPWACRRALEFLDQRLNLRLDFRDLDEEVERQAAKIAQARSHSPHVDAGIRKLENNEGVTHDESERLIREIEEFLKQKD